MVSEDPGTGRDAWWTGGLNRLIEHLCRARQRLELRHPVVRLGLEVQRPSQVSQLDSGALRIWRHAMAGGLNRLIEAPLPRAAEVGVEAAGSAPRPRGSAPVAGVAARFRGAADLVRRHGGRPEPPDRGTSAARGRGCAGAPEVLLSLEVQRLSQNVAARTRGATDPGATPWLQPGVACSSTSAARGRGWDWAAVTSAAWQSERRQCSRARKACAMVAEQSAAGAPRSGASIVSPTSALARRRSSTVSGGVLVS